MKTCPKCQKEKPESDFYRHKGKGLYRVCKICHSARVKAKATPESKRRRLLKRHYNMTLEEYDILVAQQNGRCLICDQPDSLLNVDHCHESGRVRGLLCRLCNAGLGSFKDDPVRLQSAINYLARVV